MAGNIDPEESRQEVLTEIATNVGQTFLGMTINCARCHNHKFDPILQADFYALQAVFAGAKGKDVEIATADEKAAWEAAQKAYKERLAPIEDALKALAKPFERADPRRAQAPSSTPSCWRRWNIPKDKRTPEQKRLALGCRGADQAGVGRGGGGDAAGRAGGARASCGSSCTRWKRRRPIRCRRRMPTSTRARRRRRATCCGWAIRTTGSIRWSLRCR